MAAKPTSSATPEDLKVKMLLDAARALERATTEDARKKATKDLIKAGRALTLSEAETQSLAQIVGQPGETAALAIKTIMALAEKNGQQLIDLQKRWADAFTRQGDSIANIAGAARTIATIAGLFGATEFADMLNQKADEQMIKAESYYAQSLEKMRMETGVADAVKQGIRDGLKIVSDTTPESDLAAQTAKAAIRASKTDTPDSYTAIDARDTPAPSSSATADGRRVLTWQKFHDNMVAVGVDPATQEQMRKLFDTSSKYDATTKPLAIDSDIERSKLKAGIEKVPSLTPTQKNDLYAKLELNFV